MPLAHLPPTSCPPSPAPTHLLPPPSYTQDKERLARPEEMVRLHDVLLQHSEALSELGSSLGGRQGEALMDSCGAASAACQAARCYYIGHVYLSGGGSGLPGAAGVLLGAAGMRGAHVLNHA
jgi:hypothetical protein